MKLVPLAVAALAFNALIGVQTASAISTESDAGETGAATPQLTDPEGAVENGGTSDEGSGSFSIMVPDQQGDQLLFGTGTQPLLPSFPSDTTQ